MSTAGTVLIALGLAFMVITALGMIRLPDFYSRVHAVSKSETLGITLVLLGLILHEGTTMVSLKIGLILVFVAVANPVGAHLLTRAALRTGQMPWRRGDGG
ncbi:MAG: monovalent cation/H(+) antiporter subunit G [Chloroflexi bacterium]|nr:monovalent cation/H(+) antiporter subunit G [Chloroflexota bacterium]MYB84698.1 monovalent cation/H(+) antiporter subunit G [Chloroflexota bacterium]